MNIIEKYISKQDFDAVKSALEFYQKFKTRLDLSLDEIKLMLALEGRDDNAFEFLVCCALRLDAVLTSDIIQDISVDIQFEILKQHEYFELRNVTNEIQEARKYFVSLLNRFSATDMETHILYEMFLEQDRELKESLKRKHEYDERYSYAEFDKQLAMFDSIMKTIGK